MGGGAGDGADDVVAGEVGLVGGDVGGEGGVVGPQRRGAGDALQVSGVESDSLGAFLPVVAELVFADAVFGLGGSGGEGGDLGALASGDAAGGHLGFDLGAALAELATDVLGDAGDLGDAVPVDVVEEDPGGAGKVVTHAGLEDGFGGVSLVGTGLGRRGRCGDRRGLR